MKNTDDEAVPTLSVSSPVFDEGNNIPATYTCDGRDVIPPLEFGNIPGDTKTLTIILDDFDSPTGVWDHWVQYNIPVVNALIEGQVIGGIEGLNSWGRLGYSGPCPGHGQHRYTFHVYAVDVELPLEAGATKTDVLKAMEGHILAKGELGCIYERKMRK